MNTLKLKQFITLAELLNMSKAANALYISQPALSQSISSLENELGCKLFDRVNKKLILNEQGQLALSYAKELVAKSEEMKTAIAVSLTAEQSIKITTDIYAAYTILSASFLLDNPTYNTISIPNQGFDHASMLRNRQTDIIISVGPVAGDDIVSTKLFDDLSYAIVPAQSSFYGVRYASLNDLKVLPFYRNKDLLTNSSIFSQSTADKTIEELEKSVGIVSHYIDFNSMRLMWNTTDHCFFASPLTLMAVPELKLLDPNRFVRLKEQFFKRTYYLSVLKKHPNKVSNFLKWFDSVDNEFWQRYRKTIQLLLIKDK